MINFIKTMLSGSSDVSTMRVLTALCVLNAILISLVALSSVVYCMFHPEVKAIEISSVIALCGTFLSTLLGKAIQTFGER